MDQIQQAVRVRISDKIEIKAITCSNYHAMLGFLLATGLDFDIVSK